MFDVTPSMPELQRQTMEPALHTDACTCMYMNYHICISVLAMHAKCGTVSTLEGYIAWKKCNIKTAFLHALKHDP